MSNKRMTFEEVRELGRQVLGYDDEVLACKCFTALEKFRKENTNPSAYEADAAGAAAAAKAAIDKENS